MTSVPQSRALLLSLAVVFGVSSVSAANKPQTAVVATWQGVPDTAPQGVAESVPARGGQ